MKLPVTLTSWSFAIARRFFRHFITPSLSSYDETLKTLYVRSLFMFFKTYQKSKITTGSTNDKPEVRSLYDWKNYPHHNIFNFVVFFFGKMIDNFSNRADIIPFNTICSITNSSTGFQNDSFVSNWSKHSIQS